MSRRRPGKGVRGSRDLFDRLPRTFAGSRLPLAYVKLKLAHVRVKPA
ncbi:hypothetical protein L083_2703 [Actinoplanes sp. N902-109]|nr:hypothetical protein L083_2703 [Actinoplanes sp. N902-109]